MLPFRFHPIRPDVVHPFHAGQIISTIELCGVFLCRQGHVEVSFGDQTYHIRRGDIYIYTPSTLVRLLRISDDAEGLLVEVQVSYLLPIIYKVVSVENMLWIRQHPCVSLPEDTFNHLDGVLDALARRADEELPRLTTSPRKNLLTELLKSMGHTAAMETLDAYFANRPIAPQPQSKHEIVFSQFMLNLFRHYRMQRDVAFYADLQHMAPRYFSTIIRQQSKKTPLQWIIEMVITEAKLLLEDSELSIKEIATALNFPTQSFFGKYFKQYVGVGPREYRTLMKNFS
ncbi:MAG: helix-turn-helix transcriptional regulator [Bacteroides sp.]|nr:helix-turn-helix transcriptional regulator [Bacteroides sp.]